MSMRDRSKKLMVHYMELLAESSGLELNGENISEIEFMVDSMIDAAKFEIKDEMKEAQVKRAMDQLPNPNDYKLRQTMVNHIFEYIDPAAYDLAPDDYKGAIKRRVKETKMPTAIGAGRRQVEGGRFIHATHEMSDFLIERLGYNPEAIEIIGGERIVDLYAKRVGQAFQDVLYAGLEPEK